MLYTAREAAGAVAEMDFHLRRGLPVFPTLVRCRLHELVVDLPGMLDLSDPSCLAGLGVDMPRFGQLSYQERATENPRTQDIAECARLLEHAGILVPNARWPCANLVVFCDRAAPGAVAARADHGLVDWTGWRDGRGEKPR